MYRWQAFQHAIRSQQRRTEGVLDDRRALHPHFSQLFGAQRFETEGELPGGLQLRAIILGRGCYGHCRYVDGRGGLWILGEDSNIFML